MIVDPVYRNLDANKNPVGNHPLKQRARVQWPPRLIIAHCDTMARWPCFRSDQTRTLSISSGPPARLEGKPQSHPQGTRKLNDGRPEEIGTAEPQRIHREDGAGV
jgi:hypothetical protein